MTIKAKAIKWFQTKVDWCKDARKINRGSIEYQVYRAATDGYEAGYRQGIRDGRKKMREELQRARSSLPS